jgi:formate hydrogenlyase subunit 3/multisubunit Na+/H+ antiporter MnhD subunit
MISLALLLGLLGLVPVVSGMILLVAARALSRLVSVIWCGVVLLFSLIVILLLVRLLAYGDSIQSTAFAPTGPAHWLQLSYQVDSFNIFSALVIGVLASAIAGVLIALETLETDAQHEPAVSQTRIRHLGLLMVVLGAILTAIFSNSALWMVLGWGLAECCAFILYNRDQSRGRAIVLLGATCLATVILYLSLLPAISTRDDQRLDVLAGLGREPFWAALIMFAALLVPVSVLVIQQALSGSPSAPGRMSHRAIYTLMAAPITFTVLARLALLIAGPSEVTPGNGSFGWQALGLVIIWASAALALAAAWVALRQAQRATLPLLLGIQMLSWMFAGVAVTGSAALNGALFFKLLRLLALGALLLAGTRKPAQPLLNASWWLAALALSALPFSAGFSSAWLVTSGALAAGPAWVAGIGLNWLALLVMTLAIARIGGAGAEAAPAGAAPPAGLTSQSAPLPSFLLFLLSLLTLTLGIAPEVAVNFFTSPAANALPVIASQAPGAGVQTNPLGLVSATGTWLPGLFWLLALVLGALVFFLTRHQRQPATVPPFLGGEAESAPADDTIATAPPHDGLKQDTERPRESELSTKLE